MTKEKFTRGRYLQLMIESMSYDDAITLLGLNGQDWNDTDLTKAYRSAAMKNHPDRGGSTELMQMVNAAYEQLKKTGSRFTDSRAWYEKQRAKEKEQVAKWRDYIIASLDLDAFVQHFVKTFGTGFSATVKPPHKSVYDSSSWYVEVEFTSSDRSKVFEILVTADLDTRYGSKTKGLGSDADKDIDIGVYIKATAYINRRKVKITHKNYNFSASKSVYKDPTKLFPVAKITKSQKTRKYSRRDALNFFSKELKAREFDTGRFLVPLEKIGEGEVIDAYRTVFMRVASWDITIRTKDKYTLSAADRDFPILWLPEDEKLPERINILRGATSKSDLKNKMVQIKASLK